jgi:hypothetical protein
MATADDIRDHSARCAPHLAWLRVLTAREAEEPFPPALADEVSQEISLILAEVHAAARAAVAAVAATRRNAVSGFLEVRLTRLAAAAREAADAAKEADTAALRRKLGRFEALTSAMWAVELATSPQLSAVRQLHQPAVRLGSWHRNLSAGGSPGQLRNRVAAAACSASRGAGANAGSPEEACIALSTPRTSAGPMSWSI